jgi:hypothetical protein
MSRTKTKRVIIESPYAGDIERNVAYARACIADSIRRGEAPFASHLLYTQPGILNDALAEERELGIKAGFAWRWGAHSTVVYQDLGITKGMKQGINDALSIPGHTLEFRNLGGQWAASPLPKVRGPNGFAQ